VKHCIKVDDIKNDGKKGTAFDLITPKVSREIACARKIAVNRGMDAIKI
jgi:hypothetical protein